MKSKIYIVIYFLLGFCSLNVVVAQSEVSIEIDETVEKFHQIGQFEGAVLVAKNGEVIFKKGYGLANREWGIKNETNTKFRIASITKQFTAMLALILHEKGVIRVSDSICKYVPDCPMAWKNIAIHHLMSNTSGIPDFQNFPDNDEFERLSISVEKTIDRFKHLELLFSPGTSFYYSSSGFVLLGYIIEQVTGKTYEDAMTEFIFKPLGMSNSGYDHPSVILLNRASGYTESIVPENADYFEMDTPHAAGALYSTVEDLYLYSQALRQNMLVSDKILKSFFTKHIMMNQSLGYGYGWFLGQSFNRKIAQHPGSISGFRSQITLYPEEEVFIVSLNNIETGNPYGVNNCIAAILFDEQCDQPKKYIRDELLLTIINKDVPTAIAQYYELKESNPEQYVFGEQMLYWLGVSLKDKGFWEEAIKIYEWIIQLYPESFEAHKGIADVLRMKGETKLAIRYYTKSVEINPESDDAEEIRKALMELAR